MPAASADTRAVEFVRACRRDPLLFFDTILGWKPTEAALRHGYTDSVTPDQKAITLSVRDNRRTAVPSGHGNGKTRIAAGLALWSLYSWADTIVVTTAPTATQVEKLLWGEIRECFQKAPVALPGRLNLTDLKIEDKWYAIGLSTRADAIEETATRFQGFHAPRIVIILDEATGVLRAIWEAAEGIALRPTDRILAIGNPTDPTARFKEVCDSPLWNVVRMDCRNHPNVICDDPEIVPGAVTREWVEERLDEYGGEETSLFRSKVAGLWPDEAEDTLILMRWVEAAHARFADMAPGGELQAVGCDVARFGTDETVDIGIRAGGRVEVLSHVYGQDTMATAGRLVALGCERTGVDDAGVGGGVTDRLAELGRSVTPINNGEGAYDDEKFANRRAEVWWAVREHLRAGDLALDPRDRKLAADLTNVKYKYDSRGRIKLEEKAEVKKRLKRSPDYGDALTLAVWVWRDHEPTLGRNEAVEALFAGYRGV